MKSRLGKTRLPSSTIIWSPTSWPKPISRVRRHAESPEKEKVKSGARLLIRKLAEASAIRAPQADTIAHEITASPHPYIIVCGDFNDTPISYTHRTIAQDLDERIHPIRTGAGHLLQPEQILFPDRQHTDKQEPESLQLYSRPLHQRVRPLSDMVLYH